MSSHQTPMFEPEEVRAIGECVQHVLSDVDLSSEDEDALSSCSSVAIESAQFESVQKAVAHELQEKPEFVKKLMKAEESITKSNLISTDDSVDTDNDSEDPQKDNKSFFDRVIVSFKSIWAKIKKSWEATRVWICEKLKRYFPTTARLVEKIAVLVRKGFCWIFESVMNPIRKLSQTLRDPNIPLRSKVLTVTATIAGLIITVLICARGRFVLSYAHSLVASQKDGLLPLINNAPLLATLNQYKGVLFEAVRTNTVSKISIQVLISLAISYSNNLYKHKGD